MNIFLQEKAAQATKQKDKKRNNLSPRNKKACHNISIALLQSITEIGTQSTMKRSRKTLHVIVSYRRASSSSSSSSSLST
jgi:hypothetical protein